MSGTLLGADQAPDIPPLPTDPAPAAAAAAEEAAEPTDAAEPSTTEHPPTTLTDDIHKGHYVQDAYRVAPHASVVIADGSHLHERSSGRAVHLATLCSYLAFDATGPQADPANAANTDLGWYWVGSEGAGEELGLRECRGGGGGGDAEASAQAVAAEEEEEWRRPHRIDELVLCGDDAAREEACAAAGVGAAERAWLEAHWWRAASCTEDWRREKEGVDAAAAAAAAAAAGGGEDGGAAWPAGAVWTAATAEQARDRGGRGRRALEPAQAEERERWHWTQARGGLPFEAVTYPGADGRQSSRVDAKVQALLRRKAEAAARGVRRGGPETLHVVLLSGDGDHADHLWRAAEEFLLYDYFAAGGTKVNLKKIASRHVKVWVVGRSASISKKLRRYFPSDMLRKESRKGGRLTAAAQADLGEGDELSVKVRVQHVERLYAAGGLVGGSENRPTVLATAGAGASLAGFVESVLPRYAVQFEKLVHNKGLHAFLAAAWKESCGPRVLIVDGATGCGKSTQIPQLLYDMHCYKVHEGSGGREEGGGAAAAASRRRRRRRPRILVTQPRRVACVNIAQQVLRERAARRMAWDVEEEAQAGGTQPVGYHIGGRKTSTPETPIVYCTAGVMLKKLVHADDEHWDVVVLDEVHERTVEYDLALALLLRPQTLTEARTVVIMSATLAGLSEELQSYVAQRLRSRGGDDGGGGDWFADPLFTQTFDITRGAEDYGGFADMAEGAAFARYAACGGGGGRHAVPVEYLDEIVPVRHRNWRHILNAPPTGAARAPAIWTARLRYVKEFVFDSLVLPALREEAREEVVLVFLPALALIKEFRVHIISKLKEHGYSEEDCPTHVLHGKVGHDEQQAAIQAKERVRVLLATNVAESSITIEDATTVVDLCLSKLQKLTGLSDKLLTFERTTKDSCEQRRGRVGRVRDGRCFRMITEEEWRQAKPVRSPDMDRCALHDTLLSVLNRFEGTAFEKDPASLLQQCLSPPNENKIFETLRNLETTRACEKKAAGWKLLPLGRLLHSLSVSLDLALFITWASLFSHRLGCLAADYAAMASSTFDVLLDPTDSTKACSEGALTYLSVVKRSDTVHARTRVGGHHFPSDLVTDLNFLHQYRRWRTDPFRHGAEVRALCARWSLNATALAEVEEKAAELRRTMHRHRPLLPPLPRTAEAGAAAALAAAQGSGARGDETVRVIEMLRAEGLRLAEADVPPLLFLHAAVFRRRAFEGRREMASTYSVRFTPTADDRENLPKAAASLRRVLRGALRMLRPTFEGDDHAVSVSFGNEVRGGGGGGGGGGSADDWLFPRQTLRAAQMDKCWREVVMERRIVRIDVDIPRYGFKVFPSEEAGGGDGGRERVMLRSGSAVNPLVLPVSYGCAVRLYPTTSELHESKTNAGLLTRVCAGVSVLPASATQGDGVGGDDAAVRNLPDLITLLFPAAPTRATAAAAEPEWTDEFVEAAPAEAGDGNDGDAAEEPAPDLARLAPCARASAGRLHALLGRQEGVNAHFLLDGEGSDEDNDEAADLRAEQRVFRLGAVAPEEARAAQRRDLDAVLVDVLGCGDVEGLPGMLGFPVEGGGAGAASAAAAAAVKEEGKVAEVPEWVLERAAAEEGGGGGGGYQQILHTWD